MIPGFREVTGRAGSRHWSLDDLGEVALRGDDLFSGSEVFFLLRRKSLVEENFTLTICV